MSIAQTRSAEHADQCTQHEASGSKEKSKSADLHAVELNMYTKTHKLIQVSQTILSYRSSESKSLLELS